MIPLAVQPKSYLASENFTRDQSRCGRRAQRPRLLLPLALPERPLSASHKLCHIFDRHNCFVVGMKSRFDDATGVAVASQRISPASFYRYFNERTSMWLNCGIARSKEEAQSLHVPPLAPSPTGLCAHGAVWQCQARQAGSALHRRELSHRPARQDKPTTT
jgi:hypothetical protein